MLKLNDKVYLKKYPTRYGRVLEVINTNEPRYLILFGGFKYSVSASEIVSKRSLRPSRWANATYFAGNNISSNQIEYKSKEGLK